MKITLLVALLFLTYDIGCQDRPSLRGHVQGYNLFSPGLELAYQHPLIILNLPKKTHNKLILNVAPVIDFYVHRDNHIGLGGIGELVLQYQLARQFIIEVYAGYGGLKGFLLGDVYALNDIQQLSKSSSKENDYKSEKIGIGFAKKFGLLKNWAIHFRYGFRQTNFPGVNPVDNVSFGIIFLLKPSMNE